MSSSKLWTTSRWSASSWPSRCYGRSLPTSRKRGHKPLCPRHFPVPQPAHHLHIPEQPLHSQLSQFFYRHRVFRCQGMEFVVEQAVGQVDGVSLPVPFVLQIESSLSYAAPVGAAFLLFRHRFLPWYPGRGSPAVRLGTHSHSQYQ